ncbi:hypothetical protein HWI79_2730 [Cryptosporidium felis]|nr:hypothetical protein HWI79_2730 [Cryptosporidium felis]
MRKDSPEIPGESSSGDCFFPVVRDSRPEKSPNCILMPERLGLRSESEIKLCPPAPSPRPSAELSPQDALSSKLISITNPNFAKFHFTAHE